MGDQFEDRIKEYAKLKDIRIIFDEKVGYGNDGDIWATSSATVLKVFHRRDNYLREVSCFQRLKELGIKEIDGLSVPQMVDHHDGLLIVEMTFVNPPYLLEFGKAYLDCASPYTPEQLDEWRSRLRQSFRKDDLPRVMRILSILRGFGIDYLDARPWNIRLRTEAEEALLAEDDWEDDFD